MPSQDPSDLVSYWLKRARAVLAAARKETP